MFVVALGVCTILAFFFILGHPLIQYVRYVREYNAFWRSLRK